jgi:hypothetical protein
MRKDLYSALAIAAILTLMIAVNSNLNWSKQNWKQVIRVDGKGYYAYLPAIFIYHDLNFGFFDKIEKGEYWDANNFYDYRNKYGEVFFDKYFCGTSVLQLPFFLVAHLWCRLTSGEADGYSKPYMVMISIAALFYLFIGLVFLRKLLRSHGIRDMNIAIVLVSIVFGTHLFYYSVCEAGMSHIYSFGTFSLFIYFVRRYFLGLQLSDIIRAGALLGLLTLIRPVNVVSILLLPFLAGKQSILIRGIQEAWRNKSYLFGACCIFFSLLFLQLLIYKISVGSFLIYAYNNDHFNFLDPHMIDILFSYKKGLFLYTPLLLLSLLGGFYLYRQSRFAFFTLAGFLLILTYLLSSWFMWWYGGSFSSRVFVEYIPLFGILLGMALERIRLRWLKRIYVWIVFLLVIVCQIQTYQYRYYKIHWSEMTKERYWNVFLRIDQLM